MYNKVLVEGLNLLVIVTSIQYCVNWAAYYERKFTISENVGAEVKRKAKRLRKEGKNEDEVAQEIIEAEMNMIGPKPTCFDTVPFQLMRLCKYLLVFLIPSILKKHLAEIMRLKEEKVKEQEENEEEIRRR